MNAKGQIFLPQKGGKIYQFAGVEVLMKVTKAESVGQWSLMEYAAPPHFAGPAPHFHKVMEEAFFVLEGTVTFYLDGAEKVAGPGCFLKVPPFAVHAFRNRTDQPIRLLVFLSPGGFEGYFDELQELMLAEKNWPLENGEHLTKILEKYDTYSP